MKRVLVTGSRGFIGGRLVQELERRDKDCSLLVGAGRSDHGTFSQWNIEKNLERHELVCDLEDEKSVRRLMEEFKPDTIFHLAGNPNVRLSEDDPQGTRMWRTNVESTRLLLAFAPENCRFVLASSATVYGDPVLSRGRILPCDESAPLRPTSLYAASKVAAETLVETHTRAGRVRGVSLRYIANVGPTATHGVVRDLFVKLKSPFPILDLLGDEPGSVKPYMHVADTVAATLLVASLDCNSPVNIAGRGVLSVKELAETMMKVSGVLKPINWLGAGFNWRGDNPRVLISSAFLQSLGFTPSCPTSEDAVTRAVKEMSEQCRKVA